ncbi:MAG: sulfurtransferase TusA family protein [Pseudomonadales bacterium]|nr:sulfurtransferase TusA family protein [Pseudomonadales bacterium]
MTPEHDKAGADPAVVLDVRGLNCPMPLLKAKKALNELGPGALLRVLATDPGSVRDFEVFARQSGHVLLESATSDETYVYLLRKKSG